MTAWWHCHQKAAPPAFPDCEPRPPLGLRPPSSPSWPLGATCFPFQSTHPDSRDAPEKPPCSQPASEAASLKAALWAPGQRRGGPNSQRPPAGCGGLGGSGRKHPWVPCPSPVRHQSRGRWGSEAQFEPEGVSLDSCKQQKRGPGEQDLVSQGVSVPWLGRECPTHRRAIRFCPLPTTDSRGTRFGGGLQP